MTGITDAQQVLGATGLLGEFNRAGVLAAADVHVARRVAELAGAPHTDPVTDLASFGIALAVRAARTGSTCVELDRLPELAAEATGDDAAGGKVDGAEKDGVAAALPWPTPDELRAALLASALVAGSGNGPLRPLALVDSSDGPLLYLRKYFEQEQSIRRILDDRAARRPEVDAARLASALDEVFAPSTAEAGFDRQRAATAVAATMSTTVLAGGPGTGKTYTVARILAVLQRISDTDLRIGLAAPTGRAAAQLQSSISRDAVVSTELPAVTVHRLLGARPDGGFRHGAANRLPFDVVVVDETSMLPVTLMSRLLQALRPDARLILVGDPHQLVSVEAGAVLADLVARADTGAERPLPPALTATDALAGSDLTDPERIALSAGVVTLRRLHRFGSTLGQVAAAVNAGDAESVLELIETDGGEYITLVDPDDLDGVRADVTDWARRLRRSAGAGDIPGALTALAAHRVLCAHRDGAYGVSGWSRRVLDWIATDLPARPPSTGVWAPGDPLLVTANDNALGVYNGDVGVVVARDGRPDHPAAVFPRGDDRHREVHPGRIAEVTAVYAMTIHRSQGSEFDGVTVILPPAESALLTRELLYTAISRARRRVRIVGTPDALRAAIGRRVARASGLRGEVWPISEAPDG